MLFLLTSCEVHEQDDYQEHVFVEAYATANRPLPEVRVGRTLPFNHEYHFSEAALAGANVQVVLLDENGNGGTVFNYSPSQTEGVYLANDSTHRILPRKTYRIDIDFNDRPDVLRSQTIIPDEFEILNDVPDHIIYQSPEQLELVISDFIRTQEQGIFVLNTEAEDHSPENLVPFYRNLLEDEDELNIEDFYSMATNPINEDNFGTNDNGTIDILLPWEGVVFYGESNVVVNSIDENLSDLITSQQVQFGGETISPGEIHNLRYHVEGGLGIFGSFSSDTVRTSFERPDE